MVGVSRALFVLFTATAAAIVRTLMFIRPVSPESNVAELLVR